MDNITICGKNQEEHDSHLHAFLKAAKSKNLQFNKEKCTFAVTSIELLGYEISNGEIRPDPDRMQPLKDLPPPKDLKHQKQVVGLFSYYSKWIKNFSNKIKPLPGNTEFPLTTSVLTAFQTLKHEIEGSVNCSIDENIPFTVETDASDFAIAFFSRTLQKGDLNQSSVEKEACVIVEALRHWQHFLIGKHFKLITDQKSVSYMFDSKRHSKIKNSKIEHWRIEIACYNFDIVYRPGILNVPADTLTHSFCSAISTDALIKLHDSLCYPGLTRMSHFIRAKNLPASIEEIKTLTNNCNT